MTMATEEGIRGPVACEVVGIPYHSLDFWCRTSLVWPSIQEARGEGTQRLYSEKDLVLLSVVKRLLDGGVTLQGCREVVGVIREAIAVGPDEDYWIVLGEQVEVTSDLKAAVRRQSGVFMVLDLAAVIADVLERLDRWKERKTAAQPAEYVQAAHNPKEASPVARRTVSPLTAPIAQSIAVGIALDAEQEIDIRQAQHALTWGTSWPHGTEMTTRAQLRDWFARPVSA